MPISLVTVKNDAENRFHDIDTMFSILNTTTKVDKITILKSSLILMHYNAIEGIFSNLLKEYFDLIAQNKLQIHDLPGKLQGTIFSYHLKKIGQNTKKLQKFYLCDKKELCCLSYLEINNYLNLFSGNLDSKLIKAISKELGVDLPNKFDEPLLQKIKNYRNQLAHGESKFSNACQELTTNEIEKINKTVKAYMTDLITCYEEFLTRLMSKCKQNTTTKE